MTKEFYDWLIKIFFKSVIAEEVVDGFASQKIFSVLLEFNWQRKSYNYNFFVIENQKTSWKDFLDTNFRFAQVLLENRASSVFE